MLLPFPSTSRRLNLMRTAKLDQRGNAPDPAAPMSLLIGCVPPITKPFQTFCTHGVAVLQAIGQSGWIYCALDVLIYRLSDLSLKAFTYRIRIPGALKPIEFTYHLQITRLSTDTGQRSHHDLHHTPRITSHLSCGSPAGENIIDGHRIDQAHRL